MLLPKRMAERKSIIAKIRKKGNFIFNTNDDFNDGELIVKQTSKSKLSKKRKGF